MSDHASSSTPAMTHPPKKKRVDDQSSAIPTESSQRPLQLQRRRVWRACESCRRKKIKCDGQEPICSQCSTVGLSCTWLQTKDRAALSRHYVQELEARLLHMEEVFKHVAPVVEALGKSSNGITLPPLGSASTQENGGDKKPIIPKRSFSPKDTEPSDNSPSPVPPRSPSNKSSGKEEDEMSESFGQLALDEHGHLRWIGGSSTMSLIQSFRNLTTSPTHRTSPMEEDPHSPGASANKLYFPASVYFGKVHALPGPEEVEYPDRDLADKLVTAYFDRLHYLLPAIDKPSFLIKYRSLMDRLGDKSFARAQTAFSALVFAVFACAARIIDDDRLRMYELGDDGGAGMIYYERALILHYISHASIQIAHVQCFVLLSSFLCAVNCLPQAWLLVGQAVRISQDLGLHRYARHLSISPFEKQLRSKVFWCVYSLDRMLAMALGRPLGIEDRDCDAEMPADVDDEDLQEYFQGAMLQRSAPPLMTGFIALVELYKIAGRVCREIYGLDKCKENLEQDKMAELLAAVTNLDNELTEWCTQLPATFKSHPATEAQVTMGAVLCSHYYSILTTLHRNFLPVTQSQWLAPTSSSTKAVHTARSCIRLAPSVRNVVPCTHHLAFFIQHLFSSAVIILLYAMHIPDKGAARTAMSEAESCLDVISAWEGRWPGARKCRELLLDLTATARAAIAKGTNVGRGEEPTIFPGSSPPTRPSRSLLPGTNRVVRAKPTKGKSRDARTSPSQTRRTSSSRPGRSISRDNGGRSVSRKRTHEQIEPVLSPGSPPNAFHHTFSSTYASSSRPPSGQLSDRRNSVIPETSVYEPPLSSSPAGDPPLGFHQHYAHPPTHPHAHSHSNSHSHSHSHSHSQPQTLTGADITPWLNDQTGNGTLFRAVSQDSEYSPAQHNVAAGLQYGSYSPEIPDPSALAYGASVGAMMGVPQTQGDTPPSSSFAAPGLPFPGLDFIRNYTPGGMYDDMADGLWRNFDGGEFRYDPETVFSLDLQHDGVS